jgi:hypothetical protein
MRKRATETKLTVATLQDDISFIETPESPVKELAFLLMELSRAKAHPWEQTQELIDAIVSLITNTGLDPPSWQRLLSSPFFKYLLREFERTIPYLSDFMSSFSPIAECAVCVFKTASSTAPYHLCCELSRTGLFASMCRFFVDRYHLYPAAGAALCTLFRLFNEKFADVSEYIDSHRFSDVAPCSLGSLASVFQHHFESAPMEWDGVFYQAEIWLYLAFLSCHFAPSRQAPALQGDEETQFSFIVLTAVVGLHRVRDLRGVLPFLEQLSPSGVAHCVAIVWEAECHQDLVAAGRDVVLDLLETVWSNAPSETLRVVFDELGEVFAVGEVEFLIRFFGSFLGRAVYCDEDRSRMAFLLEVNDFLDEDYAELFAQLVDQWFCNEELA